MYVEFVPSILSFMDALETCEKRIHKCLIEFAFCMANLVQSTPYPLFTHRLWDRILGARITLKAKVHQASKKPQHQH